MDYTLANSLASEALKLWSSGRLAEAADHYQRAIKISPDYSDWHGAYAGVLQQMGRTDEATREYEIVLALQLKSGASENDPSVKVARYFLGDHLRKSCQATKALEVLAPAATAFPGDWLIGTARAQALFSAGQIAQAMAEANQAIQNAGSEAKCAELREHLSEILSAKPG